MNIQSIWRPVSEAARYLRRAACPAQRQCGGEELRQMDERGLRDLGIGRGEIPYWLKPGASDERRVPALAGNERSAG